MKNHHQITVHEHHDASSQQRIKHRTWISIFLFVLFFADGLDSSVYGLDEISLIAVGDVMLGRFVEEKYHGDINIPEINNLFRSADIVFGNLESCFGGEKIPDARQPISLRASDPSLSALKKLGFTTVSLANNHCGDYGARAAEDTLSLLDSIGIKGFGYRSETNTGSVIIEIRGRKIGFLGYSEHIKCGDAGLSNGRINPLCVDSILKDISAIRPKVDILVASLHWGKEYSNEPSREQINMAHLLSESGIDVILGHHPHVLQGIENYKGKLIAYSLGNFIFDQRRPPMTRSAAVRVKFRNRNITEVNVIPLILDRYLPRPATKEEASEIKETVDELSSGLRSDSPDDSWKLN